MLPCDPSLDREAKVRVLICFLRKVMQKNNNHKKGSENKLVEKKIEDLEQIDKLTQNIMHDLFDTKKFSDTLYRSELKDNISAHVGEYNKYPELTQDLFYSMFKYEPNFEDSKNVKEDFQLNRTLTEKVMETESYKQLRSYTKLNEASSGIASATLAENIVKENKDLFEKLQKEEKEKKENKSKLKKMLEEWKRLKNSKNQQDQVHRHELKEKMDQLMQNNQKINKNEQDLINQMVCVGACNSTANNIKAQEEMFEGTLGRGLGAGDLHKVSVGDRLKFAKTYSQNRNFKKLIDLFGRMKRLAEKKQKEKSRRSIDTIEKVYQSGDINHLCSSELGNLAIDELNVLFYKKFIEKQLLTYELIGSDTKGKGAIVSCIDVSGSMSGAKDELAKAIGLALVIIAHQQKRDSFIILFDDGIQAIFPFPKEVSNFWESLIEMAGTFSGGGTTFTEALSLSMELFRFGTTEKYLNRMKNQKGEKLSKKEKKELKETERIEKPSDQWTKADLIWITDGNGGLDENVKNEFLHLKKDKKISVYSIIIDASFNFVEHGLSEISDNLVSASELDDKMAGELFEAI